MGKMSDDDFKQLVARRRDASLDHLTDTRASERREAMQFYRGDNLTLYGNSGDGMSTIVSRDLMEAIESMLPGLIKPFVAGDETARFEPHGPEDEEGAKQATEYINYLFQNHNDAFRVVYDFMKDGLLYRLGVAKVVYENVDDKELVTYRGLDQTMVEAIEAEKDHEIVGDIVRAEDGSLEVRCSKSVERPMFRVYIIAPDEFLFEPRLASLNDGRFFGHRVTKPIGDFIAMGLPKKKMMDVKSGSGSTDDQDDRFRYEDDGNYVEEDDDIARLVTIDECYVRCDYEGVGALAWRKVFMSAVGNDVLLNEEADDHPYEVWTPIPIPHKLVGMSAHDLVRDIQMQGTALVRETMNALYLANRPQREVVEGQVNFEDLLNPEIGGLVRVKQPGMVREIATGGEGVIQQSLAMVEHLAGIREQRTGSTRYNQGMDSNSLNKTATGISIIQNNSTQRQELIARHFAESGMKGIFKKMLGLVMRHLDKKQVIRLRGQWVEMDPADWKQGYDMSVAVGLGTGNRDQQVGQLMQLLELDEKIIQLQGGTEGPLLTMPNIYEKLKRLVEAQGMKGVENYYTDPTPPPNQEETPEEPEGPTPEEQALETQQQQMAAEAAANAQLEQSKFEAQAQHEMQKLEMSQQFDMQKAEMAAQVELQKAQMAAEADAMKAEAAQAAEEAKMEAAERDAERKAEIEAEKIRSAEAIAQLNADTAAAQVELDRWKAELVARTQLEAAQLGANATLQTTQMSHAHENARAEHQAMQAPQQPLSRDETHESGALAEAVKGIGAMVEQLRKPRKILRGKDGKVTGVE